MDITKIQTLIAQGKIVNAGDIDPDTSYLQVGVWQEGTRQKGAAGEAYPSFAIALSELGIIGASPLSFAELQTSIINNKLIPGKRYLITDYQTIYDQPDFDSFGTPKPAIDIVTKYGPIEPLLVTAVTPTTIGREALSAIYPEDLLWYDINFTATEVKGTPAKGRILRRVDDSFNTTGYDHRHVVFKRYESAPASGIFNQIKDNGNAYNDAIPTFGIDCESNLLNYVRESTVGFDDPIFIVPNNIFGDYCEEVNCGQDFYNNTIGSFCYATTFNHWCHDNIIGDNFSSNSIANEFSFNVIGDNATANQIQNAFQNNTIGVNFFSNAIGNNCGVSVGNTFGDGCFSNVIEDEFANNTIGNGFQHNYISDYFQGSTLANDFQQNHIKVNCNGTEAWSTAGVKAYDTSYTEVIDGFDAGGVAQAQRYIGWFDTSLGQFQYSGL